jgi:hypothetical protein
MKLFLSCLAFLFFQSTFAQQWTGASSTTGLTYRDGNVLIGDVTQHANVGTTGRVLELSAPGDPLLFMRSNTYSGQLQFGFFADMQFSLIASTYPLTITAGGVTGGINILTNGNVLVGKSSQTNSAYMLDVNGPVRANQVVVNTTGADFVFDSTYRLPALPAVEAYISEHHHLPGMAPARQMQQQGVDLGDNQTLLLQKVEELTLYVIEQQKEIKSLRSELTELKASADQDKHSQ